MIAIKYKSISTPFRHPFTTAYGLKTHQPALLIAITFNGITGFGEAPAISYYNVTVEGMIESLLSKIDILCSYSYTTPNRFWHFCHHLFPDQQFLICALDMAYWDMYAKINRQQIYELWQLNWAQRPPTDYTIGLDTKEKMLEKLQEKPWPIYKIKVGGQEDIAILTELRKHTKAIFRIDANASWSLETALAIIPQLATLNIEMIEQPLAKDAFEDMLILKANSTIPLFADESCVVESDVANCAKCFDGINVKLTKCGGITPAYRMIQEAKTLNLQTMMGCMNETEVGSYAIAQFLPLLDYVDMDGPLLLELPPLKQLNYTFGVVDLVRS